MNDVTIRPTSVEASEGLGKRLEDALAAVRERAFALFQARGGAGDQSMDDWFLAERELYAAHPAELTENDSELQVRLSVPGYSADEIEVSVLPDALVIEGKQGEVKRRKEDKLLFSEFSGKRLFRYLRFSQPVEGSATRAKLKDGVLTITLPKKVEAMQAPASAEAAPKAKAAAA